MKTRGKKDDKCMVQGHDFTASFEGGDTYRCTRCGHFEDVTEDDDGP